MINPDSFEAQAIEKHRTNPSDYFDVHVGVAPRDWMKKSARDLEGALPEATAYATGVTVFHEKGGFFTWHEDYEHGEHEPGHLLVRIPKAYWPLHASDGFEFVENYAERFLGYLLNADLDFRITDYMIVDRDITEWGNGKETFLHRVC